MINQTKVSIEKRPKSKSKRLQRQVAKEQKQPKTSTYAQKQSKRARNEKVQGKRVRKKKEQAKARKRQLKVQKSKKKGTLNLAKIGSQTFYMYEVLFYLIIRLITLLHRFHIIAICLLMT